MRKKIRLSQCMIVKNEEKNIERALAWGKDIVCEQIVVDTGSTDRTVELAEQLGAKVFHFQWIDDFSAAKNFAIEQAVGNWIAFLDADEYFLPKDVKKLWELLNRFEKLPKEEKINLIRSGLISVNDDGKPLHSYAQDRIFLNSPFLRYKNKIHEQIESSDGLKIRGFDGTNELTIYHTGYTAEASNSKKKSERNSRLLEQNLLEQPDNYELMLYLGESLLGDGNLERAEQLFRNIYDNGLDKVSEHYRSLTFYYLMKLILFKKQESGMEELYENAYPWRDVYPDMDYLMGLWYVGKKQWKKVCYHLKKALEQLDVYHGVAPLHISAELGTVYMALASASSNLNNLEDTVHYAVLCLRINKYTFPILKELLKIIQTESGEQKTGEKSFQLVSSLYNWKDQKDLLFVIRCAEETKFKALKEHLLTFLSPEEKLKLLKSE